MRTVLYKRVVIGLACGLLVAGGPIALSQDEIKEELAPPRYRVEIIVFRHLDDTMRSPENWTIESEAIEVLRAPAEPDEASIDELGPVPVYTDTGIGPTPMPDRESPRQSIPDPTLAVEPDKQLPQGPPEVGIEGDLDALPLIFELIVQGELQLTSIAERLEERGDYAPLLHIGWTQQGQTREQVTPFDLEGLTPEADLTGSVALWLGQYLHMEIDLIYRPGQDQEPATPESQPEKFPEYMVYREPVVESAFTPLSYRIRERRRVRRDETHYFDHPFFGVIALVTREPEPETSEAQALIIRQ